MDGSKAPRDWREGRRLRAWDLHAAGWSGRRIAEALGVTPGAVSQWLKQGRAGGGREALRTKRRPGKQARLTAEQRARIPELLARGAEAHGFIGDIWTTGRVATVIKRAFGVSYHPAHVSRVLRQIGWTLQKPIRRATQRDEAAITAWREEREPALRVKPVRRTAPSSTLMRPGSIHSHSWRARMRPAAKHRCSGRR